MSDWTPIALGMALFSTLMYTCLTAFNIFGLLLYHQVIGAPKMDEDPDVRAEEMRRLADIAVVSPYTFAFVAGLTLYIIMLILSVLLAVGVKKQRHQFISPWLIMGCIYVVIGFFTSVIASNTEFELDFIVVGLQTFIWFPVYTCYKKMRHTRYWKKSGVLGFNVVAEPKSLCLRHPMTFRRSEPATA